MEVTLNGRDTRDLLLAGIAGSGDRRIRQAPADVVAERFRTAYHGSPAGLALLSPSGSVSHANPALCGFLGTTVDEVIGTQLADWFDSEGKARARDVLGSVGRGGVDRLSFVGGLGSGEGRIWSEATVTVVRSRDHEPLLILVHIEDRTQQLAMLAQLSHASGLALMGRLAALVVHDLRNALTIVRAHAELLADDVDEELRPRFSAMQRATDRATTLARRLFDGVGNGERRREVVDVARLVDAMVPFLDMLVEHGCQFDVRCGEGSLIYADPIEVELVLLALIANAVDAIEGTGRAGCLQVTVESSEPDHVVRLRVADNGVGMDEATLLRATEPLFTTEPGLRHGLGLSTTLATVRGLGGSLEIRSRPGIGTTVDVTLPLGPGEEPDVGSGPVVDDGATEDVDTA